MPSTVPIAPYNAWPSIHVLLSILVVFFVRFVSMNNGTWTTPIAVVVWISCALLVASTALIKQHYVFSGISGTALAVGLWYGWIRPGSQLNSALTASALVR